MALGAGGEEFLAWVKSMLPAHYFAQVRDQELVTAFAKLFELVQDNIDELDQQTLITTASNLPPDFLNLHALGRGTSRQDGESDTDLRSRLRNIPEALTVTAVTQAAQDVLDGAGISGDAVILEVRKNKGFFMTNLDDSGTGATFAVVGDLVTFTPDTPFLRAPQFGERIFISGAADVNNDGDFEILGIQGDSILFQNPLAVVAVDATVSWAAKRTDTLSNSIGGFQDAYFDRGFRMAYSSSGTETGVGGTFSQSGDLVTFSPAAGFDRNTQVGESVTFLNALSGGNNGIFTAVVVDSVGGTVSFSNGSAVFEADSQVEWSINTTPPSPVFIVILPYGCTASTAAAVTESLRQRRGAGVVVVVECRENP